MINNETSQTTYIVVSGQASYAIGFVYYLNVIDDTPQIQVCLNKHWLNPLIYGVDYTLSEDGLSIVLTNPVAGDRIDILRNVPLTQTSDYVIGRIDPDQIERDFDLAVMREQQNKTSIDIIAEVPEDHEVRIEVLENQVGAIEDLIPTQATPSNKLTDMDFVNSSIATSTATFRGTYSSLADLEAVTADDNDYGFVVSVDAAGNTVYSRYKYDGTTWSFEYNLNNSSFTAAQWAAINSGITSGIVGTFDATGHNVGDIFWTMRNDSALNGAVDCDGTQYSVSDFTGGQSIGALLEAGKLPYVSLADYATALAANGSVGVFGWDGSGSSVFRVPSLNDIFIESGTLAQLGDYEAPALPNIKGSFRRTAWYRGAGGGEATAVTGAFTSSGNSNCLIDGGDGSANSYGTVNLNASLSSAVYKDAATTVQPNAVRYRAMVQLAITATDEALETCTSVLIDVAGLKRGRDTRVTTMPVASVDNLGDIYQYVGATDATYTNGYFYKCVSDGATPPVYSWEQTNVQPVGVTINDNATTSLTETWSANKLTTVIGDIETLLAQI